MLMAATGTMFALALRPAAVKTVPTITPMLLLQLYSTAGARVNTSLEPRATSPSAAPICEIDPGIWQAYAKSNFLERRR